MITRPKSYSPRKFDHEQGRSKQCGRACWRARWRGRCDAAASRPPRATLEAVALRAVGLDQHNPCRLDEQDTQVAIAALGYLAEDGAVAGRDLPFFFHYCRPHIRSIDV